MRPARFSPGADASIHRADVAVTHLDQVVGRQRRAEPAATVEHQGRLLVRDQGLDVALQHATTDVAGACGVVLGELVVLAHVDELKLLPAIEAILDLADGTLTDILLGFIDQSQETGTVLHAASVA